MAQKKKKKKKGIKVWHIALILGGSAALALGVMGGKKKPKAQNAAAIIAGQPKVSLAPEPVNTDPSLELAVIQQTVSPKNGSMIEQVLALHRSHDELSEAMVSDFGKTFGSELY